MSKRVDLAIATGLTGLVLIGGIVLAMPDPKPSGWGGVGTVQSISISLGAGQAETGDAETDTQSADALDSMAAETPEEITEPDPEQETQPEPVAKDVIEAEPEPEPEIVEEQPEPIPEPEPVVEEVVEPQPVVEQQLAQVLPVRTKPEPPAEQAEAPKPTNAPEPGEKATQPTPQASGLTNSVKSDGTTGATTQSQAASSSSGSGGGAASQAAMVDYQASVLQMLARYREYPERAMRRRIEGENRIRLVIARDGTVLEASMVSSSGSSILDRETKRLIKRVRKFPPFPDEMTGQQVIWTVPVAYQLR
ncbi:energy transducer TonB [Thalassospira sp. HF15]|uniref:energy transducer TonB n=1 Tax=Thalassospira sp. HF15 TaxID=2722755 RepID=UPI0014311DCF|nr:energy transducer TonB [Thalassospira sp. HF15]NIY77837.1 energy transducer TonB [Thalassospira sp. HF15]